MAEAVETEEEPVESVMVNFQIERALFGTMGFTLWNGLEAIRAKLKELEAAYNAIPQYPKLADKVALPLLADVPIDRDAMWRVVSYYRDREREALDLIKLYTKARGY